MNSSFFRKYQNLVHRLFFVTIVVYQRQIQKGNLANLAVGKSTEAEKKDTSTQFTKEELMDCFTLNVDCDCDTKEKLGNVWNEYGEYMMSTFI